MPGSGPFVPDLRHDSSPSNPRQSAASTAFADSRPPHPLFVRHASVRYTRRGKQPPYTLFHHTVRDDRRCRIVSAPSIWLCRRTARQSCIFNSFLGHAHARVTPLEQGPSGHLSTLFSRHPRAEPQLGCSSLTPNRRTSDSSAESRSLSSLISSSKCSRSRAVRSSRSYSAAACRTA
jgi:hypothetical protein